VHVLERRAVQILYSQFVVHADVEVVAVACMPLETASRDERRQCLQG